MLPLSTIWPQLSPLPLSYVRTTHCYRAAHQSRQTQTERLYDPFKLVIVKLQRSDTSPLSVAPIKSRGKEPSRVANLSSSPSQHDKPSSLPSRLASLSSTSTRPNRIEPTRLCNPLSAIEPTCNASTEIPTAPSLYHLSVSSKSDKFLIVDAIVQTTKMEALFDTGANANNISYAALRHVYGQGTDAKILHHPSLVTIANGSTVPGLGKAVINAEISSKIFSFEAIVLVDLPFEIILGLSFCKQYDEQLDPRENCITFGERSEQKVFLLQNMTLKPYHQVAYTAQLNVNNCNILISKNREFTENTGLYVTSQPVTIPVGTALANFVINKENDWFVAEELTKKLNSMYATAATTSSTTASSTTAPTTETKRTTEELKKIDVNWEQLKPEEQTASRPETCHLSAAPHTEST